MQLLLSLAAYIPRDRVDSILNPSYVLAHEGVALIADISGFTPLTEALTQGLSEGEGAEELTRALDSVFTPLIAEIHAFRGSVIKFGGDALIVWFGNTGRRAAVVRRALTCAWKMQQRIKIDGQIPTPIGVVTLKMKIGMAYGPVKRFNLGLPEYGYEDVLAGATLDLMAEAEHHAEPGDIVLPQATADLLPNAFTVQQWRDGFAVVGQILRPARRQPWPILYVRPDQQQALSKKLALYLPRPIYEALLSGQAQVAELKPVVSLFVQFHGLDYDADEAIHEKLQQYFVMAQRVVARYNGRLNRLITGDKGSLLHIIFGAPRSVEEQEARAIRCALDLQAECGGLPFIAMQRIGVSLGRVFAGPVGSPVRHDYTTMGDSINLSARLMQNAADDEVLLETAVRDQLGPEFQLKDLGHIQVKGKAEPIHVFAAVGVQIRRVRRQLKQVPLLFGREAEMAALQQRIAALATGQGSMITLIGEVGMGKTLVFDAIRAETEKRWLERPETAGLWAGGISLAYGQIFSGYLFIDLLRDMLNLPPDATSEQTSQYLLRFCEAIYGTARLESTYPYLAKFMGLPLSGDYAQRIEGLAGESLRWQVFELVPEMLRVVSGRRPVVLTLDDLQWADPTSLQLVESLLPLLADAPIFIILAMRPEAESQAWAVAQHQLADYILSQKQHRELRAETIALAPHSSLSTPQSPHIITLANLTKTAAAQLISYHAPDLPQRVVDYLVEKGGGNPLFLVEMVRTLAAKGLLSGEVDLEHIALDALDLPNSVQGLLLAQLDRLAVEARHTLQMAAVIGKTFLNKVLEAIAGAEEQVQTQLVELEKKEYIQTADRTDLGAAHTFRHILIQESTYNTLLHERRRQYHRQTAVALEKLFPTAIAEQAAFLAYHYEQAGMLDEAIYFHQQTADQARLLYAHEEAETLYHKILTLLEQQEAAHASNLDRRAKTYLKLAQVHANRLEYSAAQEWYDHAFHLLAQLQSQNDQQQATAETEFRWGILAQYTDNFDPGLVENGETAHIVSNLFEGLVELDNEWNIIPAAARRWWVDKTGTTYRFEIRANLHWSDGHLLTAHDFAFAWLRNLLPARDCPLATRLYLIAGAESFHQGEHTDKGEVGIDVLDDLTIELKLVRANSNLLYLLADPVMYPQPRHVIEKQGAVWGKAANLVGNGAYCFDEQHSLAGLHLRPNPYYQGFRSGTLSKVKLQFTEPNFLNYHKGVIDFCRVDDKAELPGKFLEQTYLVHSLTTFILGFACGLSPFNDVKARQALVHAVNRKRLVEVVWSGVQKPALGGVIPPGMPGHSPEIGLPYDPALARAKWQQVEGYSGAQIKMAAFPGFKETPQFLQQSWLENLGIQVALLDNLSVGEIVEGMQEGSIQIVLLGVDIESPDPSILSLLAHSRSSFNDYNWHHDLFDQLVDRAATELDHQKKLSLYRQADRLLVHEEAAIMPLYYLQAYGLLNGRFKLPHIGKIIRMGALKFKDIVVEA